MDGNFQNLNALLDFYESPAGVELVKMIAPQVKKHLDVKNKFIATLGVVNHFITEETALHNIISMYIPSSYVSGIEKSKYFTFDSPEDLPIKGLSIDILLSCNILEFANDIDDSIKEIHRCLKDGGQFLLITPAKYDFLGVLNNTPFEFSQKFNENEIVKLLERHNLYVNNIDKIACLTYKHHFKIEDFLKKCTNTLSSILVIDARKKSFAHLIKNECNIPKYAKVAATSNN